MSAGGGIRLDREDLSQVLSDMGKFDKRVEEQLAELDRTISQLHVTWSGTAADTQREAHDKWTAAAIEMREALAALHKAGATAHTNFNSAVQANVTMWRG